MQRGYAFFAESAALEADGVDAKGGHFATGGGLGEGQHVLRDDGASADVSVRADAAELMHGAKRAEHGVLFNGHVSGERGGVDQHGVVGYLAVMPDVGISHDEAVIADAGDAAALLRAAVDGHALADEVVITDLKAHVLAFEGVVLRLEADGAEGEDAVAGADLGRALDVDVGDEFGGVTDLDAGANDAKGTDGGGGGDARRGIDDGGGVDGHLINLESP